MWDNEEDVAAADLLWADLAVAQKASARHVHAAMFIVGQHPRVRIIYNTGIPPTFRGIIFWLPIVCRIWTRVRLSLVTAGTTHSRHAKTNSNCY